MAKHYNSLFGPTKARILSPGKTKADSEQPIQDDDRSNSGVDAATVDQNQPEVPPATGRAGQGAAKISVVSDIPEPKKASPGTADPVVAPNFQTHSNSDTIRQTPKKKPGRKPKHGKVMGNPVTVNFTDDEKGRLDEISEKHWGLPLTDIIRRALKEGGYI